LTYCYVFAQENVNGDGLNNLPEYLII
jgi:hypothetical protein